MCTNGFHYGSTCQYDCRHNSMLEEGSVRIRTCQANQTWSSHIPICIGNYHNTLNVEYIRNISSFSACKLILFAKYLNYLKDKPFRLEL